MSYCPHNSQLHCACLEHKDPKVFACNKCNVYIKSIEKEEDKIDGYKTVGCLFVGICILIILGLTAYKIVEGIKIRRNAPTEQIHP